MNLSEFFTTIVMPVISLIAGGGWFISSRQKRAVEQANALQASLNTTQNSVDLAENVAKKYNELVLSSMGENSNEHRQLFEAIARITASLEDICKEQKLVSEYLNGSYVEYRKKQKRKKTINS
jgi:hypothetical protein